MLTRIVSNWPVQQGRTGGSGLSQVWVFLIAPLVGGILSARAYHRFYSKGEDGASAEPVPEERTG